jgi:hypothetical protein
MARKFTPCVFHVCPRIAAGLRHLPAIPCFLWGLSRASAGFTNFPIKTENLSGSLKIQYIVLLQCINAHIGGLGGIFPVTPDVRVCHILDLKVSELWCF